MNKKIRIYHIISSMSTGGRERQLSTLVTYSDKNKFEHYILCFDTTNKNYIELYNLQTFILPLDADNSFKRLFILLKIIKDRPPDIVYTWGNLESIYALLLKPFTGFIFINGSIRHGIRLLKFTHLLRTFILHLSPYIVSNSFSGLKCNNLKLTDRRFVLYNGVDFSFKSKWSNKANTEQILRNKLINNHFITFVSIANFVKYKDYYTVLEVLNKIKNVYKFHYLIIGDGPLRVKIEKLIRNFQLADCVTLVGKTSDVNYHLNQSDVLIHSSRGEGLANAILEAMFVGLPVIATKVGGTPELVFNDSFRLFNYKDKNGLLKILLNIKEEFVNFNPNSAEYNVHLSKFTVDTMLQNFEKIIIKILQIEHN